MPLSLRPVHLAVLAAVVGAGALVAYLAMREPAADVGRAQAAGAVADSSVAPARDTAAARAALDRGNVAFRAGRYAEALVQYRSAARAEPASAAPQYGIHMAALKLDDRSLADSALAAIRRLADTTATDAPAGGAP